ncbi:MAG: hypothetical protein ABID63_04145 [Pseudomonadota bacterium]
MIYRGLVTGSLIMLAIVSQAVMASAQDIGPFETIPETESPASYRSPFDIEPVHMRQYRPNSTVFVSRWVDKSTQDPTVAGDIFLESVFSTSAPGFAFATQTPPEQLLTMFEGLQDNSMVNGASFVHETRFGPVAVVPFIRNNTQCISFVGEWSPTTPEKRGSRLLGYYCLPFAARPIDAPPTRTVQGEVPAIVPIADSEAQQFTASFFGRFNLTLPDEIGVAIIAEPGANAPTAAARLDPNEGIDIVGRWNNETGNGMLKFDQPSGEGSMILEIGARYCEGYWRHEGGNYQSDTMPFGRWYIFCSDGASARGHYTSQSPTIVVGEGQDNQNQTVFFRQMDE